MRRQLLTLFAVLVAAMATTAAPVSREAARKAAVAFMKQRGLQAELREAKAPMGMKRIGAKQTPAYFVFNADANQGFVVVSGDDQTPAILGYSDKGTLDTGQLPSNVEAWLAGYADQIDYLSRNAGAVSKSMVKGKAIAPMIGTLWDQDSPFNDDLPIIPNTTRHAVAGCVNTAMAQVMYYHKWPAKTTKEIPEFTCENRFRTYSGNIKVNATPVTTLKWNSMIPDYRGTATTTQKQAVASLMKVCGNSIQIDYGDNNTQGYSNEIPSAMTEYFDYDQTVTQVIRNDYRAAQWNQLMYDELANGRPVIYGGQSVGGGHAFVIEGYDKDDYFYVNWGWSGWCNGYFLLSLANPESNAGSGASTTGDGYSFDQDAIIGIQPNKGTPPPSPMLTTTSVWAGQSEYTRKGNDYIVLHCNAYNKSSVSGEWNFGWACYDTDNNMRSFVSFSNTITLDPGWFYSDYWASLSRNSLDLNTLPDGVYTLKPVCKLTSDTEWAPNVGTETAYITATLSAQKISLSWPPTNPVFSLSTTFKTTGTPGYGNDMHVRATVKNNGDGFFEDIFFTVNGTPKEGRRLEVEAGETTTLDFDFTIESMGKVTIALARRSWNSSDKKYDYIPFGTYIIDAGGEDADLTVEPTVKFADATGAINTSRGYINLHVTNNGSEAYHGDLLIDVYKFVSQTQGTQFGQSKTDIIHLAPGATMDVEATIDNLENGASYFVNTGYITGEGWIQGNEVSATLTVKFTPATLSLTPVVKNSSGRESYYDIVKDKKVVFTTTVKNTGSTDYNGLVLARIWKQSEDGRGYSYVEAYGMASVKAGATTTIEFACDKVENGAKYFAWFYYFNDGKETVGCQYTPYIVIKNNTVDVKQIELQTAEKQIYDLQGRRVNVGAGSVPARKGLYIINGKKVVKN